MVDKSLSFDRGRVLHEHIGKLGRKPEPRIYTSTAVMFLKPTSASIKSSSVPNSPKGRHSPRFQKLDSELSKDDIQLKFYGSNGDSPVRLLSVSNVYEEEKSPSKEHSINVTQPSLENAKESRFIFRSRRLNPALMPKMQSVTSDDKKDSSRTASVTNGDQRAPSSGSDKNHWRSESLESDVFIPNPDSPDRVFSPLYYGSDEVTEHWLQNSGH